MKWIQLYEGSSVYEDNTYRFVIEVTGSHVHLHDTTYIGIPDYKHLEFRTLPAAQAAAEEIIKKEKKE
ncbi:MAG: hypothetical protein HQ541_04380 [Mariniphaga sp.]|nr:hypothetical protein [Mariniphaga sp.]